MKRWRVGGCVAFGEVHIRILIVDGHPATAAGRLV